MNISLTKTLEEFVQTQVNTGMYASASEVVRAGLRVLVEQDIQQKINIGIKQADADLGEDFNNEFAQNIIEKVNRWVALNKEK